jgi:hypothetical protein
MLGPADQLQLLGVAVGVAVGVGPPPWKLNLPIFVDQLLELVVVKYSLACQNVTPSVSRVVMV